MLRIAFIAFFILESILLVSAIKSNFESTSSKVFGSYLQSSFGMAGNGQISIKYDVNALYSGMDYTSYVLVLIVTEAQKNGWYSGMSNAPVNIYTLCNAPSQYRERVYGTGTISFNVTGSDRFSVLVLQCLNGNSNNPVKTKIDLSMVNARPLKDGYQHLPIQDVMYVRVLEGELILYVFLLIGLIGQYIFAWYPTVIKLDS